MSYTNNRSDGNAFEAKFCEILFDNGWWSHNMKQSNAGQPSDIICVKNHSAFLIDCKVCADGKFRLSRIEPNQEVAMELWCDRVNFEPYFALLLPDDSIYMIPFFKMKDAIRNGTSALNEKQIREEGIQIEDWLVVTSCFR